MKKNVPIIKEEKKQYKKIESKKVSKHNEREIKNPIKRGKRKVEKKLETNEIENVKKKE
jgi:hypothetical protein